MFCLFKLLKEKKLVSLIQLTNYEGGISFIIGIKILRLCTTFLVSVQNKPLRCILRSPVLFCCMYQTKLPNSHVVSLINDFTSTIWYSLHFNWFVSLFFLVRFKKHASYSFLFWKFFNSNFPHGMFKTPKLKDILIHSTYL